MNVGRRSCSHLAPLLAVAAVCLGAITGCAKAPTLVDVHVSVDATVPPLILLRTTIARSASPDVVVSTEFLSRNAKGEAGLPGPFAFPLGLQVVVPSGWAGDVELGVEGLDPDTGKVIARGTTVATVVRETTTEASATLTIVPGGSAADGGTSPEAGAGADAPADGGDAGAPDAAD